VVRNKIKMFAQKKVTLPAGRHKIVILDEADRWARDRLQPAALQPAVLLQQEGGAAALPWLWFSRSCSDSCSCGRSHNRSVKTQCQSRRLQQACKQHAFLAQA
jgi:hypothetical protein